MRRAKRVAGLLLVCGLLLSLAGCLSSRDGTKGGESGYYQRSSVHADSFPRAYGRSGYYYPRAYGYY
jgi:hypothetical protein